MDSDFLFRAILATAWVTIFPVMLYFRLRSRTAEQLDRRQEGAFILATLRPIGLLTIIATIAYLAAPAWVAWAAMPLPVAVRWAGVALLPLGAALIVWTVSTLGPNLTDTVVTRRDHTLVTSGPYRFVRHPFYDSIACLMIGGGLVSANGVVLFGGLLVVTLLVVRTRREEDRLVARFGEAYAGYMRRTGRFVPRRVHA
jgi:protein-S-isoprenylcysteine O-methyltransferase Ste14